MTDPLLQFSLFNALAKTNAVDYPAIQMEARQLELMVDKNAGFHSLSESTSQYAVLIVNGIIYLTPISLNILL